MLLQLLKNIGKRGAAAPTHETTHARPATLTYKRGGAIIAWVGHSEGDALMQILLEMLEPLRPQCDAVIILDPNAQDLAAKFAAAAAQPVWFGMSFFGVGEFLAPDGRNPWIEAGVPFVRIFGDTPAYYPSAHLQSGPHAINGYGHAEHLDFFSRWFSARAPCLKLPFYPYDRLPKESVDFVAKERGEIIFPKNGNCPDLLIQYWRDSLPPGVARALESVAEAADAALDQPFDPLPELERHYRALGIALPYAERMMFFLLSQIDDYLRRRKSNLVARSLLDLPVVIRGVNWGHVDFSGKRARHDPDSDYTRTRPLLDRALGIVDMTPNTHRGTHDRALRAAGRYTAFLTNRQQYYVENFANHAQFTYRFEADSIRERVETALSRPRETVEMGVAQAERLRELRTPEHYARELTAALDACALCCGQRPPGTQNFVHYRPLG
jgi:hypothetical protein